MLGKMDYEHRWRDTPPEDRLKFIADQQYDQSLSLIEIKTTLINHEGRLTKIEGRKTDNPGHRRSSAVKNGGILFGITAVVVAIVAGVVTALRYLGLIK